MELVYTGERMVKRKRMRMIGTRGTIRKNIKVKKTQAVHNFVQETKSSHLSTFLKRQNARFIQQINITYN